MTPRPTGLGRGLDSLFRETDRATGQGSRSESSRSGLSEIPVSQIVPNPKQPRSVFDEDDLAALAESIKEVGLLQPIVVKKADDDRYILIMGERRLRAHEMAGLDTITAIVRQTDDVNMLRDALLENLHRVQLNPIEEAAAYSQLLEDFGCTKAELGERIQKSRSYVSNTIRLLTLSPAVQRRVASQVLTAGHARALLGLEDAAVQDDLAQRIVAEGLSVRATEEIVALTNSQGTTPTRQTGRIPRTLSPVAQGYMDHLASRLDTSVKIALGAKKGRITIDFADEDDLARIMDLLGR